jgi:hypothetical protein
MAGYLDNYGVTDAKRERVVKRLVIWGLSLVVLSAVLYFSFRNWRQERIFKQFFALLAQKNYQDAYKMWGCSPDNPCKGYPPESFTEDWGPSSAFAKVSEPKVLHEDNCGGGVVFNIETPDAQSIGIRVDRNSNEIGFAPWPRCPGRHLQIWEFLKSRFG